MLLSFVQIIFKSFGAILSIFLDYVTKLSLLCNKLPSSFSNVSVPFLFLPVINESSCFMLSLAVSVGKFGGLRHSNRITIYLIFILFLQSHNGA